VDWVSLQRAVLKGRPPTEGKTGYANNDNDNNSREVPTAHTDQYVAPRSSKAGANLFLLTPLF
jgi:hypothetical protein